MGIDLLSERARRVAAVAQRLRVVQAELADHPAEERRAHMRDEVDVVLRSIVPGERKQFLFELMDAFPILSDSGPAPAESAGADRATLDALSAAQAELATAKKELSRFSDPMWTAERLAELAPRMSEEQRRAVIKKLSTAGLTEVRAVEVSRSESAPVPAPAPVAAPAAPAVAAAPSLAADLRKAMGLAEGDAVDAARAGELCAVLAEFGGGLDELVWTAWRQAIAPSSRISRPGPLKRTMGQFVKGEAGITRQRVAEDVKLLRLITAATIAATSRAGKNYARKHLVKFSPEAIKAATGAAGWGAQAKYWAKYEELAGVETEDTIEAEIMQTIGEAARGLAEGKDVSR